MNKQVDVVMYSSRYVGRVKVREWFWLDELEDYWKVLFT